GANWYRAIAVPGKANTYWPATFARPPLLIVAQARDFVGFILITGDRDPNHDPMKAAYEDGFLADGFKQVVFHDVPGMGHSAPSLENLEKAIDELDAIPKDRPKKPPTAKPQAVAPIAATRPAAVASSRPATPSTPANQPAQLLSMARNYRSNGMSDK